MSETLEYQPTEKELALSAHARRKAFHRSIETKAAELVPPPIVPPAPTWESVAPPWPQMPSMPATDFYRECWFLIVGNVEGRQLTLRQIKQVVLDHYNLPLHAMLVGRRTRQWIRPRQLAMWLCKELTDKSLPEIGRGFGDADHTTVLHNCRRIDFFIAKDPDFAAVAQKLRTDLESWL
jgi:Bacterial dnaA protein helix-turn-helix